MKIELYTFVFQDEDFLPFFTKYYSSIVDKMTFIDSGSTDRTLELIKNYDVFQTGLDWWDWDRLHELRNNIWRGSEYDLVFFPDLDEIFYRPDLRRWLEENRYDVYHMEGYQMVSDRFPEQGSDILEIKVGNPLPLHSKYTIFDPKADINFPDAHNVITSSGKIDEFSIKLLHYKYLGAEHMVKRANLIRDRVPRGSYCKNIDGNILVKFSAFIKTREEYGIENKKMLSTARKII